MDSKMDIKQENEMSNKTNNSNINELYKNITINDSIFNDIISMTNLDKYFTDDKTSNLSNITDLYKLINKMDKYQNEIALYMSTFTAILKMCNSNHVPLSEVYKSIVENSNKLYSVNKFVSETSTINCNGIGEDGIECDVMVKPNALYKINNYEIMLIDPKHISDYISHGLDTPYNCVKDMIYKYFKTVNEFVICLYVHHMYNKHKKYNFRKKAINTPNILSKTDVIKMQKYAEYKPKTIKKEDKTETDVINVDVDLSSIDN